MGFYARLKTVKGGLMSNAVLICIVGLALFLQGVARPSSALAVSEAECEAWLCLPGGFSVSECAPAKRAGARRLSLGMNPLPPWSSCVPLHGDPAAGLALRTGNEYLSCPGGYNLREGVCVGLTPAENYATEHRRFVWVLVDGERAGVPYW